jgi:hypothetical protein
MAIPLLSAPGLIMQGVQATYKNTLKKPDFLRSFFKTSSTGAITVSHETRRKSEIIAKDRERNSGAQTVRMDKSTLKQFKTPYYALKFPVTELDTYDRIFGSGDVVAEGAMDAMVEEISEKVDEMQQQIERSYELQASQALFDRKLVFEELDDLDFLKKADSEIAASANGGVWATDTSNILTAITKICQFITGVGSSSAGVFNGLATQAVINQILTNQNVIESANLRRMDLIDIKIPQYASRTGAIYYGTLVSGGYQVHLWSYDQQYINSGSRTGFIPENKFLLFPMDADFRFRYAGVGQKDPRTGMFLPKRGEWHVRMLNDEVHSTTNIEIASSGLAVPYSVDQIGTILTNS